MAGERKESWLKSSANKGTTKVLLLIFIFASMNLIFLLITAREIWKYPEKDYQVPKADFAIVLGASTDGPKPTPVFQGRIQQGIDLYHQGMVQKLIFTGGPGNPPQAVAAKAFAQTKGVPETDILIEDQSINTVGNIYYAKKLVPNLENKTFLIVSDPLHLKRAQMIARDLELKTFPAPTKATLVQGGFEKFKFLVRETLAYTYYQMKKYFDPEGMQEDYLRK